MNRTTQDLAWSVLPKEFKEEVKFEYHRVATKASKEEYDLGFMHAHEGMFGHHNLTSDAEGEEMLTVPRKDIIELYQEVQKTISQCKGTELAIQAIGIKNVIWSFFGSKCLPDEAQPKQKDCDNPLADKEGCRWRNDGKCAFDSACYFEPLNPQEPKSAEPKFKVGQKVKYMEENKNLQKSFCRFEDTADSIEAIMEFVTDNIAVGIDYSDKGNPILNLYKEGKLFTSGKAGDYVVNDNGNFYIVESID